MRAHAQRLYQRLRPALPLALIAAALAALPFSTCLSYLLFHLECPGCGLTRATLRLLHGDVAGSVRFHPLALPGAGVVAVSVALALALPEGHPLWERYARAVVHVSALALWAVWVARLFHLLPWA